MQVLRSAPYFPVPDVGAATGHYESVLGFRCEYTAGEPAQFAIVSRDGFGIMLRLVPATATIVPNEKQDGTWDAFFWVSDLQSLHAELVSKGATIVYGPLFQASYRMNEFAVRDSNGYVLGFGEDASDHSTPA